MFFGICSILVFVLLPEGGTVHITAHEIQDDGLLRELYQASGGCWGGTTVDKAFNQF